MRSVDSSPGNDDLSVAFVTKSYAPDLERCELLCRSLELLAPGVSHWIIVDRRDWSAFQRLETTTTRIVMTEDLLPRRVTRLAFPGTDKNVWIAAGIRPMRGWLVQQLVKLAVARVAREEVMIHADSDVVLIRRFRAESLIDANGALSLFRVPGAVDERLPNHVRWHRNAEQLLGISARPFPLPDYVGGLIPWRRELVVALLDHIEARSRQNWIVSLARARDVSEYVLYGRFVEDVVHRADVQVGSSRSLCRCYWGTEPLTNDQLERMIDEASPDELALMVSAKAGMRPKDYAAVLDRHWAALGE